MNNNNNNNKHKKKEEDDVQRVEPDLDLVVGAPGQLLGDDGPLVAVLLLQRQDRGVLLRGPLAALQLRVQVVAPPLPALLRVAPRDLLGDDLPRKQSVLVDELGLHNA